MPLHGRSQGVLAMSGLLEVREKNDATTKPQLGDGEASGQKEYKQTVRRRGRGGYAHRSIQGLSMNSAREYFRLDLALCFMVLLAPVPCARAFTPARMPSLRVTGSSSLTLLPLSDSTRANYERSLRASFSCPSSPRPSCVGRRCKGFTDRMPSLTRTCAAHATGSQTTRMVAQGGGLEGGVSSDKEVSAGPQAVVISGPSGVGKGSIITLLLQALGLRARLCISHTTRRPRAGEEQGVHYYYTSYEEMKEQIEEGAFLEHAKVHGNLYGTSRSSLDAIVAQGQLPLLDVDVQGAKQLRASGLEALYVFVAPPSLETLRVRLEKRGSEDGATRERRLAVAAEQMLEAQEAGLYDRQVVNSDLAVAASCILEEVRASVLAQPRAVLVLGGPGSGKGTQSGRLVHRFGYVHLSAGDLLRAEQARQSPESDLIKQCIAEGKIVPVDITCRLLLNAMHHTSHPQRHHAHERLFLIDGFPRNVDNLEGWERVVGSQVSVSLVIFLKCPREVMEERLLLRGKTSGRADDNPASIQKRFKVLEDETMPVVKLLRERGLVYDIQGDQTEEDVFQDIQALLLRHLPPLHEHAPPLDEHA